MKRLAFYRQLSDSVRHIPGVEQAGVGLFVPMSGGPMSQNVSAGTDSRSARRSARSPCRDSWRRCACRSSRAVISRS